MKKPPRRNTIHLLLPGISNKKWKCGALLTGIRMAQLLESHAPTQIVTYIDREKDHAYLDDILSSADKSSVFICAWGGHVNSLITRLQGRRVAYFAQSVIWKIDLPVNVPVLCVSRFIMAYMMDRAPHNPLFLLGPVIESNCYDYQLERDIDVLFLERKSTEYLNDQLVPSLQDKCKLLIMTKFVSQQELFKLYNRSKVYLYSSAPRASGAVEGFGLQPLEAILCGCVVFSNLDGGLSDFLEPELNSFKVETYSLAYDMKRILAAVKNQKSSLAPDYKRLQQTYSEEAFHQRIERILSEFDSFFNYAESSPDDTPLLTDGSTSPSRRSWQYRARGIIKNIARRLM